MHFTEEGLGHVFTATKLAHPDLERAYIFEDTLKDDCRNYVATIAPLLPEGVTRFSTKTALEGYLQKDWNSECRYPERVILMELLIHGVELAEAKYALFLETCEIDFERKWVIDFWERIRRSDRYMSLLHAAQVE